MRTYLAIVAAIVIGRIAALMSLAGAGIYACMKCDLLRYQESKIPDAPGAEIVVLGDSSIGYGLDAGRFSDLSGKTTLNLALTGYDYGIGGAYVLLTELLSRSRPKNVLISLTPQSFSESMAELNDRSIRGLVQASRRQPGTLFTFNWLVSLKVAKTAGILLVDKQFLTDGIDYARGARATVPDSFGRYDYLEPSRDQLRLVKTFTMAWQRASNDYDVFFGKIARLCAAHGVNCLYMHGPLVKMVVDQNQEYIKDLGNRIERAGITVVGPSPIAIPDDELGNTINHIRPDARLAYTEKIFEFVKKHLR